MNNCWKKVKPKKGKLCSQGEKGLSSDIEKSKGRIMIDSMDEAKKRERERGRVKVKIETDVRLETS